MQVKIIKQNKKDFLELLLLGDEQENMIDKYLERSQLFALYDNGLKSICAVSKEDEGIYEVKNIATYEQFQGKGYGKKLIEFIFAYYQNDAATMLVGTGEVASILNFYKSLDFKESHRIKNFFLDNCEKPIFEEGIQLVDMIYLKKQMK